MFVQNAGNKLRKVLLQSHHFVGTVLDIKICYDTRQGWQVVEATGGFHLKAI